MPTPQLYTVYVNDKKANPIGLTLNEAVDDVKRIVERLTLSLKLKAEVDHGHNEKVQATIRSIRIVPE